SLDLPFCLYPCRDVDEGDDKTAVRQAARMELEYLPGGHHPLRDAGLILGEFSYPCMGKRLGIACAEDTALPEMLGDVEQQRARKHQFFRQVKQLAITRVGGREPQLAIEDGDPLRHEIDRVPQGLFLVA